jgi:hypothetical protein
MNKILIVISIFTLLTQSACKSVKEGLSGTRENNSDEFLVQKKSPLSKPPDFEKLPEPRSEQESEEQDQENEKLSVKDIFGSSQVSPEKEKTKNQSIEEFILDKIKKN